MRFIAYQTHERALIGRVDGDSVEPLCGVDEFYADPLGWRDAAPQGAPVALADVTQVPPVPATAQILCVGLNYADHIAETGRGRPEAPNLFARWYSTLVCDGAAIPVPSSEPGLDWEVELAVIVGRQLTDVDADEAMDAVLGYTCFNDVSARHNQATSPQWALAKNARNSGPIGPVVVTADEYGDPYGRRLETRVNGETVQSSTTDHMIFKIGETLAHASRCITLRPGDVLATGTPSGVGFAMDPPRFMHPGDIVEVEVEEIGVLRAHIV